MRLTSLAIFAGLLSTAACAPSGYYDSAGAYHSYGASDSYRTSSPRDNGSTPGGNQSTYRSDYQDRSDNADDYGSGYRTQAAAPTTVIYDRPGDRVETYRDTDAGGTTTVIYDRPGYYDYNGYYISSDSGPEVPGRYFPPHGMCRIWFTNRPISQEPPVESCAGIDQRVPSGAYVVYGG